MEISPLLLEAIGFNGERIDPATGLYHLGQGYRTYNPALKRFHQFDSDASPFGRGGVNGYLYCFSNPVTFYDPTGRSPDWAAIGQGIAGLLIAIGEVV